MPGLIAGFSPESYNNFSCERNFLWHVRLAHTNARSKIIESIGKLNTANILRKLLPENNVNNRLKWVSEVVPLISFHFGGNLTLSFMQRGIFSLFFFQLCFKHGIFLLYFFFRWMSNITCVEKYTRLFISKRIWRLIPSYKAFSRSLIWARLINLGVILIIGRHPSSDVNSAINRLPAK